MSKQAQSRGRARSLLGAGLLGAMVALAGLGAPTAAQAQQPYLGEVICGGWTYCPNGWGECNGQLLAISENDTLFNLIGTTYGGDGQSTFALPDLRGRTVVGQGAGPGLTNRILGDKGGVEEVTLTPQQIPAHSHPMTAFTGGDKSASPTGKFVGAAPGSAPVFSSSAPTTALSPGAVSPTGQSQPHNNLQPYLAVKCCIALFGIFPSPN